MPRQNDNLPPGVSVNDPRINPPDEPPAPDLEAATLDLAAALDHTTALAEQRMREYNRMLAFVRKVGSYNVHVHPVAWLDLGDEARALLREIEP